MLRPFVDLIKSISFFPGWSDPDKEDGYSYFQAPLSINGVVEGGLFLTGGCYRNIPDKHVTFEILLLTAGGSKRTKIMRVDWRSIRGGHTNQRKYKCPDECPKRTEPTHFHSFDTNWLEDKMKMRGPKLPCAIDLEDELETFESLKVFVGKNFRIDNMNVVEYPPWEYTLDL